MSQVYVWVSVAPTNVPRSNLPHSWQFMLYILLVSQLDMQYLHETFGWTFGISTPNCAPTFEAHKAASGHHPLFTWLARLDTVRIVFCPIYRYSNYNRAGPFKLHLNNRGVDLMCDCMMLILRVCLRFVESFGGDDAIVNTFCTLP